jgi:hypothetical protein
MRKKDVKVGAPVFWEDPDGGTSSRYIRVAAVGDEFVALTELGDPSGTIVAVVPPRELTGVPVDWRDDIENKLRPRFKLVIEVEYDLTLVPPKGLDGVVAEIKQRLNNVAPNAMGDAEFTGETMATVTQWDNHVYPVDTPAPGEQG